MFLIPDELMGAYVFKKERNYGDLHARRLRATFRRNSSIQGSYKQSKYCICIISFLKKFDNDYLVSKTISKKVSLRLVIFWILLFKRSFPSPPAFTMYSWFETKMSYTHELSFYRYATASYDR